MPFAQGVQASVASRRATTEREQIQFQAEKDRALMAQRQQVAGAIDQQAELAAAQARNAELDARDAARTIDKLDGAFVDAAYGDLDAFHDLMGEPENAQMLKEMPAIREAFGAGISGLDVFNENNQDHIDARDSFAIETFEGRPYDHLKTWKKNL